MKIELHLGSMTCKELTAFSEFLLAWKAANYEEHAQPAVASNTGSTEPVVSPGGDPAGQVVVQEPEVAALPASTSEAVTEVVEKPKRAKKVKEEAVVLQQTVEVRAAFDMPAVALTIDDLRAALQRFTAANGMPAGIELLKGFDCARISELAEKGDDVKAAFVAKCPVLEAA